MASQLKQALFAATPPGGLDSGDQEVLAEAKLHKGKVKLN